MREILLRSGMLPRSSDLSTLGLRGLGVRARSRSGRGRGAGRAPLGLRDRDMLRSGGRPRRGSDEDTLTARESFSREREDECLRSRTGDRTGEGDTEDAADEE